ncbi:WD repeat-containing protein 78 [Fundulus heteroclitus]|uniref:WD repeat-containing protein 78 n=1 Tax=Fundulus heteroclitus TaxID=8078 RepID=UPI00165AF7A2|nr:WD repeat-containing protein 78 [Fundulus heteroclitus]
MALGAVIRRQGAAVVLLTGAAWFQVAPDDTKPQQEPSVRSIMSATGAPEGKKRRRTVVLRPSKRSSSLLGLSSRRSFTLGCSKVLDRTTGPTPRQAVRVFDEENNDVTPQPLHQAGLGAEQANRFLVEELSAGSASDQTTFTGSFTMPFSRSVLGSSRISSQSTIESVNEEMEETFSRRDLPLSFPDEKWKKDLVKEQVTQALLKVMKDIFITETDTISLLEIAPAIVSVDADDAEVIIERNKQYEEVCRKRISNEKYVDRAMQTLNEASKNKQIQNNLMLMVDAATTVSTFDMYEHPEQEVTADSPEMKPNIYAETVVESSRSAERSLSMISSASTVISSCSLKDVDAVRTGLNTQSDLELIRLSEKFQYSLLLMERSVLRNSFQCQLASYRQLPLLEDPDRLVKPKEVEEGEGRTETSCSPALECLWRFSCELSIGCSVSCMAWNQKNPDLLAVGYGESDSRNQEPGLVCCWSIKNPRWPERIIHCDSAVTTLDFSANSPGQLAVGMCDGSIAVYNVQSAESKLPFISSRECAKRHIGPVWQLRWNKQELSFTGEEKVEALFSVGADGRICKWFIINGGLDCTDLMKLKRSNNTQRKTGQKPEKMAECGLSALTPGLCFDFHPIDSNIYLTGTWEGNIHKCSCSNSHQFLETYKKHFCPVNWITWCPFHPDVFLSCSSDSTIQLWKQDCPRPLLSFSSNHGEVCEVKWSPRQATVFGAVYDGHLEVWDLNSSFLDPVIVQPAAPGLKMTSFLFASLTDCVLVGDSYGQVTVYQMQNLRVGECRQGDVLEVLLCSASSREL